MDIIHIKEAVTDWLRKHGYDGLWLGRCCACELSDLMPSVNHPYKSDIVARRRII
jgi:hypothetical protein